MILYLITNIVTNKMYCGQTMGALEDRWSKHKQAVGKKNHPLYNAMKGYGIDQFRVEVIDWAQSIEELNTLEEQFIAIHDLTNRENGYNLQSGGKNKKQHQDTIRKMSSSKRKDWSNPEYKEKVSKSMKGKLRSKESKAKMALGQLGAGNNFFGRKHSEETKKRISESNKRTKNAKYMAEIQ